MELMEAVWKPAVARVREEVADMQAVADKEAAKVKIEPWDYRYYAEKVRKAKYDLDQNEVKPYLQLEKLREGMFWVAGQLFGFTFSPVDGVPVYQADMRVYKVTDPSGKQVGLWYFDPYARPGKQSGAWMNAYRNQERFDRDITTIVSNNTNFVKGKPGEPILISWDDANALFHEFGHALHGLSSAVTYPRFSGTAVPRDFVEFPSQVNEMWALWPEVLRNYARHVETGEPLPRSLVESIDNARLWGEGFATLEYLAATLLDQAWHRIAPDTEVGDPIAFERQALADAGVASALVPPRYRTTYFQHIFAGGYAAGYYSYIWSEVLDADTVEWFKENGGLRRANGDAFRGRLLSVGGSVDPLAAFRAVRGRDADPAPLLRRRGLAPAT
jgi:peptidyl-dipeptidase Dcp